LIKRREADPDRSASSDFIKTDYSDWAVAVPPLILSTFIV